MADLAPAPNAPKAGWLTPHERAALSAAVLIQLQGVWPPEGAALMVLQDCAPYLRRDPDFDALRAVVERELPRARSGDTPRPSSDLRRVIERMALRDMQVALDVIEDRKKGARHG